MYCAMTLEIVGLFHIHGSQLLKRFFLRIEKSTETELRVKLGMESAAELIKARGRWASDIGAIYSRALVEEHLDASVAMGDSVGEALSRDMEEMCAGWVQPASFR